MTDEFSEFSLPEQPTSLNETVVSCGVDSTSEDERAILIGAAEYSTSFPPDGRYQLRHEIDRGGMGVVVGAYDKLLRRDVAVKLLLRKFMDHPSVQKQFIEEALLTSCLQHPSIVPIYDRGYALDKRPFFVMKLVSGSSLSSVLADGSSRLDRAQLLKVFEQICQTVSYAHSQGILHLDIKPGNVMIADFGEVLLMDWGQAKSWKPLNHAIHSSDHNENKTTDKFRAPLGTGGTPAYMSPEQARGNEVSPASDVFSLGALLCEILIGRPVYKASNAKQLLSRARKGDTAEAVSDLDESGCDSHLVAVTKQCLAKSPEDRPEDARMVAKVISKYLETALEQAESDRCRFFDLTLDMFCIATFEGFFVRLNANFTRVLGYSEHELLSQPFLDFVHPDDHARSLEAMNELLAGKPVIRFYNRYRHADGSYRVFEWTAQALPHEGNIFAVARDVTDRQVLSI